MMDLTTLVSLIRQKKSHTRLTDQERKALEKLRNRDVVIFPADEGCATVVMYKADYIKEAEDKLKEEDMYQPMNTNLIKKLDSQISTTVNKLVKREQITKPDQ